MSEGTKIQWADDTWNPWRGCQKVSEGCKNCYAEKLVESRMGGKFTTRSRHAENTRNAPLRWNKKPWVCEGCGHAIDSPHCSDCIQSNVHRRRVFSLSLGDWLDDEVPIYWLAEMLDVIRRCPELVFLLLTKRPELCEKRVNAALKLFDADQELWTLGGLVPHNIWLGTSVENQAMADLRIPQLLRIPAAVRFLSVEPLLGPVDLWSPKYPWPDNGIGKGSAFAWGKGITWVIVGGESGPKARPCNVEWIRSVVSQCKSAGVPVFVKQLGRYVADAESRSAVGIQEFLDKKGGDPSEWPQDLRVRQWPKE